MEKSGDALGIGDLLEKGRPLQRKKCLQSDVETKSSHLLQIRTARLAPDSHQLGEQC